MCQQCTCAYVLWFHYHDWSACVYQLTSVHSVFLWALFVFQFQFRIVTGHDLLTPTLCTHYNLCPLMWNMSFVSTFVLPWLYWLSLNKVWYLFFRVLFYVQRMPSSNTSKGTWYESSRASSEWPQYAALYVNVTSEQVCTHALKYALPLRSLCHKKQLHICTHTFGVQSISLQQVHWVIKQCTKTATCSRDSAWSTAADCSLLLL